MSKKYVEIGLGVIWDSDRQNILIDQRLPNDSYAGYWEFPGGKVEPGEDVPTCIQREIKEELGIEIAVGEHLITVTHDYPEISVALVAHNCQYVSGEPQPIECADVRWVSVADLGQYQFLVANGAVIAAIQGNWADSQT